LRRGYKQIYADDTYCGSSCKENLEVNYAKGDQACWWKYDRKKLDTWKEFIIDIAGDFSLKSIYKVIFR